MEGQLQTQKWVRHNFMQSSAIFSGTEIVWLCYVNLDYINSDL
jgi:hypothetical protein